MEAVIGWGAMDLYSYGSFSFPTLTYSKYSAEPSGFTAVWNAIVPFESSVLLNTGAPTNGLCIAVTVTFLPGTVKELLGEVGLVISTSEEVHFWKGMSISSLLFFS